MRKCLLIFTLFWVTVSVSAQSDIIAKLKFEEAEEAFQNGDFSSTLSKLEEAEKLLRATNPKIEYLRILAQYNLVEQNNGNDFSMLASTRKDIAHYLKNYASANEDKYKEVYKVSEQLNKYPKTIEEFNSIRLAKELKKKQQLEAQRQGKIDLVDKEIADLQQQLVKMESQYKRGRKVGAIFTAAGLGIIYVGQKVASDDDQFTKIFTASFGSAFALMGSYALISSFDKSSYKKTQDKINELETKKSTITFSPTFDYSNKSAGLSLSLRF